MSWEGVWVSRADDNDQDQQLAKLYEQYDPKTVALVLNLKAGALKAKISRLEWSLATEALATGLLGLCTSPYDWRVGRRSVAAEDARAPSVPIGQRTERLADLIRYEAAVNIRIAADHMQGFSALLSAERSVLGAATLARGIFEACTWASAVIDPSVTQRERLRRIIMRRIVRLMAGMRETQMLAASNPDGVSLATAAVQAVENEADEHGTHLDPATEVEDLVTLAQQMGWKIRRRQRSIELDEPLSIDWLVKNLGQRAGVEQYVWGNGSALAHGEHTPLTVFLSELVQDTMEGRAPGWVTRLHATGSWAGPRLLLATFAEYTGHNQLLNEFREMDRHFWANSLKS